MPTGPQTCCFSPRRTRRYAPPGRCGPLPGPWSASASWAALRSDHVSGTCPGPCAPGTSDQHAGGGCGPPRTVDRAFGCVCRGSGAVWVPGWAGAWNHTPDSGPFLKPGCSAPSCMLQVSGYLYSGSTGRQIGHRGSLGVGGTAGSLLHVTRVGAHYILFPCRTLCLRLQDRPSRGSHMPEGAEWGKPGSPGRVLVPEGQGWPAGSAGEVSGGHRSPGSRAGRLVLRPLRFRQQAPCVAAP